MAQDIINDNQKISYTNLDFSSIYLEVMDLIKKLTYRWDPSISDESDPGVILVKLSALIADKCNYNIDKNILETFPLSVTQDGNARQLYDQLGYYMDWYESASVPIAINWTGEEVDTSVSYKIPKFTAITDSESSHVYSLVGTEGITEDIIVSDIILPADGKTIVAIAMEGTPVQYQFENETVITAQMVDPISRRLYFPHSFVAQNGVFIKNTAQENYASWKRVNNLYENSFDELRYIFGYDSNTNTCFLEFPDNYSELFGSGIEIVYLVIPQETSDIPAQALNQFLAPISINTDEANIILDSSNVKISNYIAASGHKDIESINEAYINYKKTVGTFKTLITLRDYLNFIKSKELDICSNAFVCDRTNDIQSTYKIISNKHDLDTIVVKVEQIVDKTSIESTFDYKFKKSADTEADISKKYYSIINDTLEEVDATGENPKENGWYELESIKPDTSDALSPFSLKFYLLRKAISLNTKTAYNQTFTVMNPYPDINSLLENTSHIEHTYEDILPLGESTYKKSTDVTWEENKSYWILKDNVYTLITDTSVYNNGPVDNTNVYELDVEALLPHTVLFKAIYPVTMNISTYNILDQDTQALISSNIISSLYSGVNSSQVDFGSPILIDYLVELAKNSDDRIKSVTIDPIVYDLYATYYDRYSDSYIEVQIDDDMSNYNPVTHDAHKKETDEDDYNPYRNEADIVSALIKKDIMCKSILAGTSQLLVPDKVFVYHLSQKYIDYVDNISNITGEATIDIQNDSSTSYSIDDSNTFIRKSYTVKDNEVISLYRPKFESTKTFTNNVHFEYVLYKGVSADSTYKLENNEYIILYNPIKDSDSTTIIGYSVYACSAGSIISTTQEIEPQMSISALSNFAKDKIVTYFTVNPYKSYYEMSTYNENYKTEIRNSSSIINNVISGTNEVNIKELSTVNLYQSDKYKFFWVLSEPTYSNNSNLKTYTLFPKFNSEDDINNYNSEDINTYTLKNNELLIYTNSEETDLQVLGPGTTIIRNCGVDSSELSRIENSLYFLDIDYTSMYLEDSVFQFITREVEDDGEVFEYISPHDNGLFVINSATEYISDSSFNPYALNLYEKISVDIENETYTYLPSSDNLNVPGKEYYEVVFERSTDYIYNYEDNTRYFILVMRKQPNSYLEVETIDEDGNSETIYILDKVETGCFEEIDLYSNSNLDNLPNPVELGLYEPVIYNNNYFIDEYALNDDISPTRQSRYTLTDDNFILTRRIFSDNPNENYSILEIGNKYTYCTLDFGTEGGLETTNPMLLKLLEPIYSTEEGDEDLIVGTRGTNKTSLFKDAEAVFSSDKSGYYYQISESISNNGIYKHDIYNVVTDSTSPAILATKKQDDKNSPFDILKGLFNQTRDDTQSIDGTVQLKAIEKEWKSTYSYQKPYMSAEDYVSGTRYTYRTLVMYNNECYKCVVAKSSSTWVADEWVRVDNAWAVKTFKESLYAPTDNADVVLYIKIKSKDFNINVSSLWPALESGSDGVMYPYFYVNAIYEDSVESFKVDNNYYEMEDDGWDLIDSDRKLRYLFPGNSANIYYNCGDIKLYLLPRLYEFNDFCKFTYKKYYKEKNLFRKTFGEVSAWTCTSIDYNDLRENPIKNIGTLWATIQNNTSLTIIQNEIETFSSGDILIFDADQALESYVRWPIFTNSDIILNPEEYNILYQRVGQDIRSIDSLDVDSYKWRGYSSLVLNTSSSSGQKLSYNHKLSLYNDDKLIGVIDGGKSANITFQLKYPVENKYGTFINVSKTDTVTEKNLLNSLYAFEPIPNGNYYAYDTSNYKTYLYFKSNVDSDNHDNDYLEPKEITIPIGLPQGNYLLGMDMKNDIILTIEYSQNISSRSNSATLNAPVINYYNINAPATSVSPMDVDHLFFALDSSYTTYLNSYVDEDRTEFIGDKYDYIKLNVDSTYCKVRIPSYITGKIGKSPKELGWYELVDGEYVKTSIDESGADLLVSVGSESGDPVESGWYVKVTENDYGLPGPTSTGPYYKEPELFVHLSDISSLLKFNISSTTVDLDDIKNPITYTILDVFKYNNNDDLGDSFDEIRNKIKLLDRDEEYNYMFIPTDNDLIKNPLTPKSFFNSNHVFNKFTIPQMNFDALDYKYITTKV